MFKDNYDPLEYDTNKRKKILDECKNTEEMLKLVYKWIWNNKIMLNQYLNLLNYIVDKEEK